MASPIEAARVLAGVLMLGYASWRDLRTREVPDITWIVFGSLGLILDVYEVATGNLSLLALSVPVLSSTALAYLLGYIGLYGGADFKAFVVLAVLQPYAPRVSRPILNVAPVIYPLTVFSNSAFAGSSFAIVNLVRNLAAAGGPPPLFESLESEALWKKFIVLISGVKVRLDTVRGPPFQYPLEVPAGGEGSSRRLVLMPDTEDDEAAIDTFHSLRRAGVERVWVSHTLPFMVFITLGYISAFVLGDLAMWLLKQALFP
ncbi:MAG: A24 family peptidase C-terminal domain-containing protein [Candidatus Bathyarchaeia archaeon]